MIAPEGWPFVLIPASAGAAAVLLGWPVAGAPLLALSLFSVFFFRNPDRSCSQPEDVACSPADGRVLVVQPSPEAVASDGLPVQVSVFMSVADVHVNRAPITGTLVGYSYNPGRKLAAFKEKASMENEQNLSVWEGPAGRIAMKQIAGLVARRIVFDHRPGATVRRSERVGLIRFGSRVDRGQPIPGTPITYVGQTEDGAELGNVEGYPYRKLGDSIQWEGKLRDGIWLQLNARTAFVTEERLDIIGTADLWIRP
mgnify:CR=1 FL=1